MGHLKDLKNNAHKHVNYVHSLDDDHDNEWEIVKQPVVVHEPTMIESMSKKYKLTVRRQLQVLHYLGELVQYEGMNNNTKKAAALAKVLGKKDTQQIREIIIHYPRLVEMPKEKARVKYVKGDLEYLLTVFTQEKRFDIVSQVKQDLARLK